MNDVKEKEQGDSKMAYEQFLSQTQLRLKTTLQDKVEKDD